MQIFDRYILKEFIKFLLGSVTLFTGVGMITRILESLKFVSRYNGESSVIWLYYLYSIPYIASIVMAPSFILAASYIMSRLIQSKELMITRSSGRSIKRTLLPVVVFSFFFSFLFFAFNEYIVYPANFQAYAKKNFMRGRTLNFQAWRKRYRLNLRSKSRVFFMDLFNPRKRKAFGLHIVETNEDTGIKKIIRAEEATIVSNSWLLKKAEIITFKNFVFQKQLYYQEKVEKIPEDISAFQRTYRGVEEASIFQLSKLIKIKKERGDDPTTLRIEFYWHFSFPSICFFFVLIGVIVSIKTSEKGLATSLSLSILCGVIYFIVMFYTKALGSSYLISPFWAGSLGNFVVGGTGLFLWFKLLD